VCGLRAHHPGRCRLHGKKQNTEEKEEVEKQESNKAGKQEQEQGPPPV